MREVEITIEEGATFVVVKGRVVQSKQRCSSGCSAECKKEEASHLVLRKYLVEVHPSARTGSSGKSWEVVRSQ